MTIAPSAISPVQVRDLWIDSLLDPSWIKGTKYLRTRVARGSYVIRECPLGRLMQLAVRYELIKEGYWLTDRRDDVMAWSTPSGRPEFRLLTKEVADWAGITQSPKFYIPKDWYDDYQLLGWPKPEGKWTRMGTQFCLTFLNDHTAISAERIAQLISEIR